MLNDNTIDLQRNWVFSKKPLVNLLGPCSAQRGIMRLSQDEISVAIATFRSESRDLTFFIPASGSGSRMFEFLYDFFKHSDDDNRMKVERFLNHLNEFAFSRMIDSDWRQRLEEGEIDLNTFAAYIVEEYGLGFGAMPKGLIPFHEYAYFVLNPFQEHVLQCSKGFTEKVKIHFTVNWDYHKAIQESIDSVMKISSLHPRVSFSEQDKQTDSVVFKSDGSIYTDEAGVVITRPSGHGALLDNLNRLDARYVFIKNIDNIQHLSQDKSEEVFSLLGGVLIKLHQGLLEIYHSPRNEWLALLRDLNQEFHLFYNDESIPQDLDVLSNWLMQPKRVCGMVRNEGQPGGGPFWVEREGVVSKQIVEKAQISHNSSQLLTLVKSTHFNPVMMACDLFDLDGTRLDLTDYQDADSYMVVEKKINGESIRFLERPGLWNGSMTHWTTVFIEVPADSFSPVKDVLNLLDSKHIQAS